MAFNLFKRKPFDKAQGKQEKKPKPKAEVKEAKPAPAKKTKKRVPLPDVLLKPHITEKASALASKGEYVFQVGKEASKGAIRQAVESLYGVDVQEVRLIRKPARKIRLGRRQGVKPGMKKAVVQLKSGQTIEAVSR